MRISCRIAVILVIFSGHAWAKPKKANPKHPGTTMDSNDPVDKEKSDDGPFTPEGKTGPLKREEVKQEEAERVAALPPINRRPRDPVGVFGNLLIGFGKAPVAGPGENPTTGRTTEATFMVGGHYDLSPSFTVGARLPFSFGSARQADGLYASSAALGALELMGEERVSLTRFTLLPIDFGLGVPIAQGDYQTATGGRQLGLNAMADAASGYRDPELFGPKRLPIIAGVGIDYQKLELDLHAATKFVAGVKVGGPLPDDAAAGFKLKSVSFRNVTSAGIAYQFLDKPVLFGALDSWLVYNAINALEYTSPAGAAGPTRFQVVFEPRVGARFGKVSPSLGYVFPIGGRLADAGASGLELHCDIGF
ncbi:MAG TPA: hypothetical protein VGF76_16350 [Polyangiaceae bacterium]